MRLKMSKTYKRAWHTINIIAICIFSMLLITCYVVLYSMDNCGLMNYSGVSLKKVLMNQAAYDYAIWAVSDKDDDFNEGFMEDKGCNIGVIEGNYSDLSDIDLNDDKTYVFRNFSQDLPSEYYTAYVPTSKDSEFILSDRLYDFLFTRNNDVISYDAYDYQTIDIKGIGYDIVGQMAYIWDGEKFLCLEDNSYKYAVNTDGGTYNTCNIYDRIWENQRQALGIDDDEDQDALYIDGKKYPALGDDDSDYVLELYGNNSSGILSLSYVADITSLHDELERSEYGACTLDSVSSVLIDVGESTYKVYTVICFPGQKQSSDSFFVQASRYLKVIPALHVLLPILAVISAFMVLILVMILILRAGRYENKGSLNTDILADIPMEIAACIFAIAEMIPGCLIAFLSNSQMPSSALAAIFAGFGIALAIFIGIVWFESVVINFKRGHFWENTLCFKLIRAIFGPIRASMRLISRSVKWSHRIIAICLVISFAEFMGLATIDDKQSLIFIWFLEKIVLAIILIKVLKQYASLKKTAVEMANGNMDVTVDTSKMYIDLEEHGNALNKLGSGLNTAISERMKSERLKTELITNVSHDIKTPLTSVINYVDLLQKEDIENETARSYLEVLDRQAKRLKKLIEDLIEASKAATGSIKFNMENINARVLINQSVGEFDDRLTSKNITVVTEVPDKDVYVKADNRYLFRIFDNLLSNIVKYSQEGTRAYIELLEKDGRAQYTFKNISKDKLNISSDELMERFVRGDISRNTEGNGLGLSIARSLTESMGGQMDLTIDGDLFKATVSFPITDMLAS